MSESLEPRKDPKETLVMVGTLVAISVGIGVAAVATYFLFFQEKPDLKVEKNNGTESAAKKKKGKSINLLVDGSHEMEDAQNIDNTVVRYINEGKYEDAIPLLEFSVKQYKAKGNRQIFVADHLHKLANCFANKKEPDFNKAFSHYKEAIAVYDKLPGGAGGPQYQQCLRDYASVLRKFGQADQAKELEEKANRFRSL